MSLAVLQRITRNSLVPRPPTPSFCRLQYEKQGEGLVDLVSHVIRAAIDVTACLLELITQGVRPPYVPLSTRADDNGKRQSLE